MGGLPHAFHTPQVGVWLREATESQLGGVGGMRRVRGGQGAVLGHPMMDTRKELRTEQGPGQLDQLQAKGRRGQAERALDGSHTGLRV